MNEIGEALKGEKLSYVVCVAGGWAGGGINDPSKIFVILKDLLLFFFFWKFVLVFLKKNTIIILKAVVKNAELMWKQSVHSSIIASQIAAKYLAE